IFGDRTYSPLVVLTSVSLLCAVPSAIAARVLNGILDLRSFSRLMVAEAAAGMLATAALVARYGLTGAVVALLIAEIAGSAVGCVLLLRCVVRPLGLDLRPRRPDGAIVRRLVRYASALTVTSVAAAGASLFVRSQILHQAGADANGLYQVAWQVGQNYLGILS